MRERKQRGTRFGILSSGKEKDGESKLLSQRATLSDGLPADQQFFFRFD